MASLAVCAPCLRALRQSARNEVRSIQPALSSRARLQSRQFSVTASQRLRIEDVTEQSPTASPLKDADASTLQKFAQRIRAQKQLAAATEPYVAYGATEDLFRACAKAGSYTIPAVEQGQAPARTPTGEDLGIGSGWWYEELGLKPTFNTWAQVTYLHMYLLTARLRMFPEEHAHHWHQNLLDHFSYAAEDRMAVLHNISARSVRNKYLKDLFVQWRGCLLSYDEGLIKGDAVLATAVWRNVFGGDENVDAVAVAEVVSWMKKSLRDLDRMQDSEIASGDIKFATPAKQKHSVAQESKWLKTPFNAAELAGTEQGASR